MNVPGRIRASVFTDLCLPQRDDLTTNLQGPKVFRLKLAITENENASTLMSISTVLELKLTPTSRYSDLDPIFNLL